MTEIARRSIHARVDPPPERGENDVARHIAAAAPRLAAAERNVSLRYKGTMPSFAVGDIRLHIEITMTLMSTCHCVYIHRETWETRAFK